jgi:hypothetical protein
MKNWLNWVVHDKMLRFDACNGSACTANTRNVGQTSICLKFISLNHKVGLRAAHAAMHLRQQLEHDMKVGLKKDLIDYNYHETMGHYSIQLTSFF